MDNTDKNFVPDWKLEQYLFGELPTDELETISVLEASDESVRGRVGALRKNNAEVLEKFPPEWEIRKLRALSAARTIDNSHCDVKNFSRWAIPAVACAAAALVMVLTHIMAPTSLPPAPEALNDVKVPDSMKTMIVEDANFLRDTILLEQGW